MLSPISISELSWLQYSLALTAVFITAISQEALQTYQKICEAKQDRAFTAVDEESCLSTSTDLKENSINLAGVKRNGGFRESLFFAVLRSGIAIFSYSLMICAMSLDIGVLLFIVLGLGVGNLLFAPLARACK